MASLPRRAIQVASLIALGFATALAAEPEWPGFRGPASNPAVLKGSLPEKWSTTENIEWTAQIPGRGWSSPIVSGRQVFLTSVTTEGKSKPPQKGTEYSNEYVAELSKQGLSQKEVIERVTARDIELPHEVMLHYFIYCLDLDSGKVEWKRELFSGRPPGGRHRKNSFASETPVTDGKLVYVYLGNLGLFAYDLKGTQIWHTPLEAYPIYLDFGTGGSAALWGNQLVIVNDNEKQQFIAAFDKNTGKQIWRTNRDLKGDGPPMRSGWVTPFVWETPKRTEIVTVGPGIAVSYDADGKELWRLSGMSPTPIPSPFAYQGLLYLNGGRGKSVFAIKPGATGDLTPQPGAKPSEFIAWSQERSGTYLPTQVAYDGALYVLSDTGILSRFDAKTGAMSYRSRLEAGGAFTSSPWAYNGKIFCLSEEGKTFVVKAGEKFELLRENSLDEMAQATPAMVGDRLLLRTESRLYSIREKR
ncbi:MAG TPA: PQQ-binding-like beta-propeller repeat protein [Bryobacteraceae bacterium]|jgi:outer membrane protein assembly factor BamB|nr:PQQ-binding-like beta-propeller repeat protein [Bryobacteraceae bacterium]